MRDIVRNIDVDHSEALVNGPVDVLKHSIRLDDKSALIYYSTRASHPYYPRVVRF